MQETRKTSHIVRKASLAAALIAAAGGTLALGNGGIVRVAGSDYSTAPANPAPGASGRMEGDRGGQPPANTSMGDTRAKEAVTDGAITTKIKAKLLAAEGLKSTSIHVKTKDGTVNVSGTVASKEQHDLALDTIRNVKGVNSVHDGLKVSSP